MENKTQNITSLRTSYIRSGGVCYLDDVTGIYIYIVFLLCIMFVAVIGNVLVLVALYKYERLRKPSNTLLGILACIDLVSGGIVVPIKIWSMMEMTRTSVRWLVTKLNIFVLLSTATVLFICVDQVLKIVYMQRYNLTKMKMLIGLTLCWLVPMGCLVGFLSRFYIILIAGPIFFVLCTIMIVCLHIYAAYRMRRHAATGYGAFDESMIEEIRSGLKTALFISIACVATSLTFIVSVACVVGGSSLVVNKVLCAISIFALLANSAVNPVIYIWKVPYMKGCIAGLFKKTQSEQAVRMAIGSEDNEDEDGQCLI